MTLPELLSALERADGPSRELDAALWLQFGHLWPQDEDDDLSFLANEPLPPSTRINGLTMFEAVERYPNDGRIPNNYNVPRFTASVDAALALVERALPGCFAQLRTGPHPWAEIVRLHDSGAFSSVAKARAPTPALALCLALVRALASEGEQT